MSTLATSLARAEVKDPLKLKFTLEGLKKDGLTPEEWLLIQEVTLRELNKDAKALPLCEESLKKSQEELNLRVDELNVCRPKVHELEVQIFNLQTQVYDLENPPWYKSATFWAPTGFVLGVITTVVAAVVLK